MSWNVVSMDLKKLSKLVHPSSGFSPIMPKHTKPVPQSLKQKRKSMNVLQCFHCYVNCSIFFFFYAILVAKRIYKYTNTYTDMQNK